MLWPGDTPEPLDPALAHLRGRVPEMLFDRVACIFRLTVAGHRLLRLNVATERRVRPVPPVTFGLGIRPQCVLGPHDAKG